MQTLLTSSLLKCGDCSTQGLAHEFIDVESGNQQCPNCGSTLITPVVAISEEEKTMENRLQKRQYRTPRSVPVIYPPLVPHLGNIHLAGK